MQAFLEGRAAKVRQSMSAPELLWRPPADVRETTEIGRFLTWLERERGLAFDELRRAARGGRSTTSTGSGRRSGSTSVSGRTPRTSAVLGRREMPGAAWFPGATLNYAEHARRAGADDRRVAVLGYSQTRDRVELTWAQLRDQVARARAGLQRLGVGRGDRVVAYLPNIPETLVAFLATASLGAMWASCAPEFGARSVVDRFGQIEPTVLLAVAGYGYGSKDVDRREQVAEIRAGLPTVEHVVHVPYGANTLPDAIAVGASCSRSRPISRSTRCRSTTRCACCSPPAPPASRRRSCTATAGSCSST